MPLPPERADLEEDDVGTEPLPVRKGCFGQCQAVFPPDKLVGLVLGVALYVVFLCLEVAEEFPKANDMLAIVGLVGTFWVFEVLPLPVTSLLPVVLMPFQEILSSKEASSAYWGWVQMLFIGAFVVDTAIEHVNLHRRASLGFLLKVGVKFPWVVVLAFATISYFMSMWCTNTATTVMLTPFATGLLDTVTSSDLQAADSPRKRAMLRRYSVGILLMIAYGATCGGIATIIGTIPNGILAGLPEVNSRVSAQDWLAFAFPVSLLGVALALAVVYAVFVRGVSLEMDPATLQSEYRLRLTTASVARIAALLGVALALAVVYAVFVRGVSLEMDPATLQSEYRALGPIDRDEVVVGAVQILQIVGWLSRRDLINSPTALGIKGVNDATIACAAAVILFFVPSVKHPGETILTWDVAQLHLPWGMLLLMGGGFAIARGFQASELTRLVGESLAAGAGMNRFALVYAITGIVCFLTEVTSNTATANIMLPILASVATETLTHPLALMLPAAVACSFAFMLPAATPPNAVVFATKRITIRDFVKAGLAINLLMILLGAPVIFAMGSAVYDANGPFPRWACLPATCRWVSVPGTVAGREVASQACAILVDGTCKLRNGTVLSHAALLSHIG